MNKAKYAAIAHQYLRYCSPINDEMVDEITDLINFAPGMTVIDMGCAKAEILIRMADRCQVKAVGIDTSEEYLVEAQAAIANRVPAADIILAKTSVSDYKHPENVNYDTVMCVNSSELFGSYDKALMEIAKLVKSGGTVLMGDYYWRDEAKAEMSEAFRVNKDYMSAIEIGLKEGLTPLFASRCTTVDLDRYIWMQVYAIENYAREHPEDEDLAAMLDRARLMRNLYIEYGHKNLGFGLFLFRKP